MRCRCMTGLGKVGRLRAPPVLQKLFVNDRTRLGTEHPGGSVGTAWGRGEGPQVLSCLMPPPNSRGNPLGPLLGSDLLYCRLCLPHGLFCGMFTTSIWRAVQEILKAKTLGTQKQTPDSHIWPFLSPSNLCERSWKSHTVFEK